MSKLRIGEKIDSDHHPVEIEIIGEQVGRKGKQGGRMGRGT